MFYYLTGSQVRFIFSNDTVLIVTFFHHGEALNGTLEKLFVLGLLNVSLALLDLGLLQLNGLRINLLLFLLVCVLGFLG